VSGRGRSAPHACHRIRSNRDPGELGALSFDDAVQLRSWPPNLRVAPPPYSSSATKIANPTVGPPNPRPARPPGACSTGPLPPPPEELGEPWAIVRNAVVPPDGWPGGRAADTLPRPEANLGAAHKIWPSAPRGGGPEHDWLARAVLSTPLVVINLTTRGVCGGPARAPREARRRRRTLRLQRGGRSRSPEVGGRSVQQSPSKPPGCSRARAFADRPRPSPRMVAPLSRRWATSLTTGFRRAWARGGSSPRRPNGGAAASYHPLREPSGPARLQPPNRTLLLGGTEISCRARADLQLADWTGGQLRPRVGSPGRPRRGPISINSASSAERTGLIEHFQRSQSIWWLSRGAPQSVAASPPDVCRPKKKKHGPPAAENRSSSAGRQDVAVLTNVPKHPPAPAPRSPPAEVGNISARLTSSQNPCRDRSRRGPGAPGSISRDQSDLAPPPLH